MEIVVNILVFLLLILFISTLYTSSIVPFFRLYNFGKKLVYINVYENKLLKVLRYIVMIAVTAYFLHNFFDSYATVKSNLISAPQNLKTALTPFMKSSFYLVIIFVIIGSLPCSAKECIYECGIKTKSEFVKWNEIKEIKIDGSKRILIYYKMRTIFFIKVNNSYIIEDYSEEIKNLIFNYWNQRKD